MIESQIKIGRYYTHLFNKDPRFQALFVTGFGYKDDAETVEGYYMNRQEFPQWWWIADFVKYFKPVIAANDIWKSLNEG